MHPANCARYRAACPFASTLDRDALRSAADGVPPRPLMQQRFATEGGRLEAFSDGVIAVIITIMVLDLRPPHGVDLGSLRASALGFATYALSFVFIGIYWNNHHHLLRAAAGIDARVMWANLHLLFWLSLVPYTTTWLGEDPRAAGPTALYAFVLLMDAVAFTLLQAALIACNGRDTPFARAVARDVKGKVSLAFYVCAIGFAFVWTIVSDAFFLAVALMWFVPDRRLEPVIADGTGDTR